jgi:hypothetical protein
VDHYCVIVEYSKSYIQTGLRLILPDQEERLKLDYKGLAFRCYACGSIYHPSLSCPTRIPAPPPACCRPLPPASPGAPSHAEDAVSKQAVPSSPSSNFEIHPACLVEDPKIILQTLPSLFLSLKLFLTMAFLCPLIHCILPFYLLPYLHLPLLFLCLRFKLTLTPL